MGVRGSNSGIVSDEEDDEEEGQTDTPPPRLPAHLTVNGASWLASTIDLEKIFLENGEPARTNHMDTHHTHYPLIQFAERYFNVHTVTSGYSGAISKTVNKVRLKGSSSTNNVSTL